MNQDPGEEQKRYGFEFRGEGAEVLLMVQVKLTFLPVQPQQFDHGPMLNQRKMKMISEH